MLYVKELVQSNEFPEACYTEKIKFLISEKKLKPEYAKMSFCDHKTVWLLTTDQNPWMHCYSVNIEHIYQSNRKEQNLKEPAKLNAPIKYTSSEKIKLILQSHHLKCKQLGEDAAQMK